MVETVRIALLLCMVGLPADGVNAQSAVQFTLDHQRPDGGWSENPALNFPEEKTWLSSTRSLTWLTADAVDLLRRVGMGQCLACQAALDWLRSMQNGFGGWPSLDTGLRIEGEDIGDPDATAQITFLMGEIYGEEDDCYTKGRQLFERHLDACARDVQQGYWVRWLDGQRSELDAYTLTHLLLSWVLDPPRRFERGYNASDPRVKRMMAALRDIQMEDGGWRPFFSEESSPLYTLIAIKTLALSGVLAREALQGGARVYAF